MKAYIFKNGKLELIKTETPKLQPHYVLVKNLTAGINHLDMSSIDEFDNTGKVIGFEGTGEVVEAHTSCVKNLTQGMRVCYAKAFGSGTFAEMSIVHEDNIAIVPNNIPTDHASTAFKALAAHMLLFRSYNLKTTDCIGFTSPSGGVASYAIQWAAHYGVKILGLCYKQEHKAIALSNGCSSVFMANEEQKFIEMAKKKSHNGFGLNVFYDSIGAKAYSVGIKSLAPFGLYNHYGSMMGELKGMSAKHFQMKSLFFNAPSTFYSKANSVDYALSVNLVFESMQNQILRPNIHRYKFSHLSKAFSDIKNGLDGQKVLIME